MDEKIMSEEELITALYAAPADMTVGSFKKLYRESWENLQQHKHSGKE